MRPPSPSIDRCTVLVVVGPSLVCVCLLLTAAYVLSYFEFSHSVLARDNEFRPPPITYYYRIIYTYAIVATGVISVVWVAWLLRRPKCRVRVISLYVGIVLNLALFWFLLTLLALYCENQTFYGGL